jgi:hypothetical protein
MPRVIVVDEREALADEGRAENAGWQTIGDEIGPLGNL